VDAKGGIQKVRVEPATRSAVATCNQVWKKWPSKDNTFNIISTKKTCHQSILWRSSIQCI